VKYLLWLLKAAIFFTLFAFALNNQQVVALNFFFGTYWQAPMVLVVLAAFCAGLALGVLVMVPRWWRRRPQAAASGFVVPAAPTPPGSAARQAPSTADMPERPHGI
jgi:putative membrane protein